jgi:hypothetical protein
MPNVNGMVQFDFFLKDDLVISDIPIFEGGEN